MFTSLCDTTGEEGVILFFTQFISYGILGLVSADDGAVSSAKCDDDNESLGHTPVTNHSQLVNWPPPPTLGYLHLGRLPYFTKTQIQEETFVSGYVFTQVCLFYSMHIYIVNEDKLMWDKIVSKTYFKAELFDRPQPIQFLFHVISHTFHLNSSPLLSFFLSLLGLSHLFISALYLTSVQCWTSFSHTHTCVCTDVSLSSQSVYYLQYTFEVELWSSRFILLFPKTHLLPI